MALSAPSAFAATPSTTYALTSIDTPFPQPTGRFGERHAATDDIDRDGVNDYFVGALSEDVPDPNDPTKVVTNGGRVYAISGKTRAVIYTILSPEIQANANFGFFISVLGDVDGDRKSDIAIGTDSQDVTGATGASCTIPATGTPPPGCNKDQGKAWVFSGANNGQQAGLRTPQQAPLYPINNPDPQADGRFGSRIGRAGDIFKANGTPGTDGVPESIMGASNNDVPAGCGNAATVPAGCRKNQGQAYIFNGTDGKVVRTLNVPAGDQVPATCGSIPPATPQPCGSLGLSVQGPGDVDGDNVPDQLVDAGSLSVTPAGAVCAPGSPDCNVAQGAMYLYSGASATGNPLARIDDPTPQANAVFGFQDAAPLAPGDLNNDGRAEIFANGFQQAGATGADEGRVWIFDGKATVDPANAAKHGVVLFEPKDPTPSEGGQFAFSLDKTDYNKDGTPDLYVGQSPHHLQKSGVDQSGGTYVFDGRNGALLKSLELPPGVRQPGQGFFSNLGSNLGWSVAAPGDLNGDGEPDYLAGATFQDMGANQDEGRAFVFLSGPSASTPVSPGGYPLPPGGGASPGAGGKKLKTRLTLGARPRRDRRLPFRYTFSGRVKIPAGVSKPRVCGGRVRLTLKKGSKTVARGTAKVSKKCTYRKRITIKSTKRTGRKKGKLRVSGRYGGNKFLRGSSKSTTVRFF